MPKGFEQAISYGGLGYVVPHTLYPVGQRTKTKEKTYESLTHVMSHKKDFLGLM